MVEVDMPLSVTLMAEDVDGDALAFAADGLPDGFHRASSELYRRMAVYRDAAAPPSMEDVAKTLLREPGA